MAKHRTAAYNEAVLRAQKPVQSTAKVAKGLVISPKSSITGGVNLVACLTCSLIVSMELIIQRRIR